MAVANRPAKAVTQNERLLAVLEKEPGILTTDLRSRADELGMSPDSISQALYLMEKAGKIHYGESSSGRSRPCFAGPGSSRKSSKAKAPAKTPAPAKTKAAPAAAVEKRAKAARPAPSAKSAPAAKKTRAAKKTSKNAAAPATAPSAVFPAPAIATPTTALTLHSQEDLMTLVSQPGGMEAAITSFATQIASAVAQRVANQVREQLEKQVVQQVSEAVAAQMTQLTQSISMPGMPGASAVPIKPHRAQEEKPQGTRTRGSKAKTVHTARRESATEVQPPTVRKKVVVVGLKPRFTKQISAEFSNGVDLAFAGADESADRLERLVAEADQVMALTNTKSTRTAKLVKAHPHYSKVSGGLPKLVEALRGMPH
jgi:hypothetical protein